MEKPKSLPDKLQSHLVGRYGLTLYNRLHDKGANMEYIWYLDVWLQSSDAITDIDIRRHRENKKARRRKLPSPLPASPLANLVSHPLKKYLEGWLASAKELNPSDPILHSKHPEFHSRSKQIVERGGQDGSGIIVGGAQEKAQGKRSLRRGGDGICPVARREQNRRNAGTEGFFLLIGRHGASTQAARLLFIGVSTLKKDTRDRGQGAPICNNAQRAGDEKNQKADEHSLQVGGPPQFINRALFVYHPPRLNHPKGERTKSCLCSFPFFFKKPADTD